MATEFIINKGLKTNLFNSDGTCKIQESLIENAWYLTLDEVCVYVAIKQADNSLKLTKLNESNVDFEDEFLSIHARLTALENKKLVLTYADMTSLPRVGDPDIIYAVLDPESTYVFANGEYVCIGSAAQTDTIVEINGGSAD